MISVLQIVVIIAAIAFFAYVISLVAKNRMLLKYSLLWMLLTVIAAICAIFPTPIYRLSTLLGFETPSNFIFFMGLLLLMAICLSLSVIVSGQTWCRNRLFCKSDLRISRRKTMNSRIAESLDS